MADQLSFVHLLLFRCAECDEPLLVTATSDSEHPGQAEDAAYDVRCACGWLKRFLGLEAMRHYAVPWTDAPSENYLPDRSIDGDSGLEQT